MIRPTHGSKARAFLIATTLAVAAPFPAFAQDGATPREIPEGFIVPGPAPTNAPQPGADAGANSEAGAPPAGTPGSGTEDGTLPSSDPVQDPMAFATTPKTGTTDWPCVQRQVNVIQPAQVWAGADLSQAEGVERPEELTRLVDEVAARRMPLDEAEERVKEYLEGVPEDEREQLASAFVADLLERLNRERGEVMAGIERYGSKQKQMAAALRKESEEFAEILRDPESTNNDIENARQKLLWQTRIFEERRGSLTYVCEVPVLIEQRAFALGRAAQQTL